jgi:hypothetical protein
MEHFEMLPLKHKGLGRHERQINEIAPRPRSVLTTC